MAACKTMMWLIDKVQMFLCLVANETIQLELDGITHNNIVPVCLCCFEAAV